MKIGILLDQLTLGGFPKVGLEEVRLLRELGHDAELVVVFEGKDAGYAYDEISNQIPVVSLSSNFPFPFNRSFRFPFFSFFSSFHITSPFFAWKPLKQRGYDVLVAHGSYTCFTSLKALRKSGMPYIAYIWDPISYVLPQVYSSSALRLGFPVLLPLARHFDKRFTENAAAVVTGLGKHRDFLQDLSRNDTEVLTPGCRPCETIPDKRGDYLLSFTKWDVGKRPEFLLDVMEKLRDTVSWKIAGGWWPESLKDQFLDKARARNLLDRVEVTGALEEQEIVTLLCGARVLVHPIAESFGMTALEAAACGCPFIIPRGSGVAELFGEGNGGWYPAEGDADGFAAMIKKLLEDERLAWDMGTRAWQTAKRNTWSHHAERLYSIIERAVS